MFNANYEMFKSMIAGKKIAVLGLGVSNLPAIKFLHSHGAIITGCDQTGREEFDADTMKYLDSYCVSLQLGDTYLDNLTAFDILLKSPGIRPFLPELEEARAKGVVITSEMEIFMSLCPCKIIGVTGSDGKTTTTTLIYEMLKADGKICHVGGNIGTPLLDRLDEIDENDYVVLELSSFQLQIIGISPDISVITNITPNHLDYHKNMEEYTTAKANIFKFHHADSRLVLNLDNDVTRGLAGKQSGDPVMFSRQGKCDGAYVEDNFLCYNGDRIINAEEIRIPGVHNVENYLAAIAALYGIVDKRSMIEVAKNFGGVAHRMEYVRKVGGVEFYNDSIGSSPTRTIAGLVAHKGKIVLIAGGYDKKLSFAPLGEAVNKYVTALVLCGATSDAIEQAVCSTTPADKEPVSILKTTSFEAAVKGAYAIAKGIVQGENDKVSVILSPACASFDMFKNFEVRGNTFKDIVNSLK